MCESVCRLQEIKTLLNKNLKLIKISYVGIKSDNKNIRTDASPGATLSFRAFR